MITFDNLDFGDLNFQPGDFEYEYINEINFKSIIRPWLNKRTSSATSSRSTTTNTTTTNKVLNLTTNASLVFLNTLRTVLYNVVFAGLTIFSGQQQQPSNSIFATAAKNFYGLNERTLAQKFPFLFAYLHNLNIIPIDYITANGDNGQEEEVHKLLNTPSTSSSFSSSYSTSANFTSNRLADILKMGKKSAKPKDSKKRKQDVPVDVANGGNRTESTKPSGSRDSKKQKKDHEKIVIAGVSGGDSPEESNSRNNEERDLKRKDSPDLEKEASATRSSKRAKKAEQEPDAQENDTNETSTSNGDPTPMDIDDPEEADQKDLKRKSAPVKNDEETPTSATKSNKKSKSNSSSEPGAGREVKGKKRHDSPAQNGTDKSHKKQKSTHDEAEKSSKRKEATAADKIQANDSKKHKKEHGSEEASATTTTKESRRDKKKRKIADAQLPDRYAKGEKEADAAEDKEEEGEGEGDEEKGESGSKPAPKGPFKVFIGNIPFTATSDSLKEHLKSLSPASIRLPMHESDPTKAKGFAFVEFHHPAQMKKCLLNFHNTLFEGRKIRVELSAGGGGNSQTRKSKIAERNSKLDEQRKRRHDEVAEEKEVKKARRAEQEEADGLQMHPSRQGRMRK